jgi:hypothetical protein
MGQSVIGNELIILRLQIHPIDHWLRRSQDSPLFHACFQLIGKCFVKLLDLGPDHGTAIGLLWMRLEVVLVVLLGRVKNGHGRDFGHDGLAPSVLLREFFLVVLGALALMLVVVKHDRAVLRPDVCTLAVERGGVMDLPKNFQ